MNKLIFNARSLVFFCLLILISASSLSLAIEINKPLKVTYQKNKSNGYELLLNPDKTAVLTKIEKGKRTENIGGLTYTWKKQSKGVILYGKNKTKTVVSSRIPIINDKLSLTFGTMGKINSSLKSTRFKEAVDTLPNGFKIYDIERNGKLSLNANYIYSEKSKVKAQYKNDAEQTYELSRGYYVDYIEIPKDEFLFTSAVMLKQSGPLNISLVMQNKVIKKGQTYTITVAGQTKKIVLNSNNKQFKEQSPVSFNIPKAGLYKIELKGINKSEVNIRSFDLSGEAIKGAQAILLRWRPFAHHGHFTTKLQNPKIAVVSFEKITDSDTTNFMPVTSPLGYLNPHFFSVWCGISRGDTVNLDKTNYLVGVSTEGEFGSFNHEGVGVKVVKSKDPEAIKASQEIGPLGEIKKYTMAIRCEPFNKTETQYTIYYYHPRKKKWLYRGSCIKKTVYKPVTRVGAFLEPLGSSNRARNGSLRREARYKAWFIDQDNKVHNASEFSGSVTTPSKNAYLNTFLKDGYAYFVTGGWDIVSAKAQPKQKIEWVDNDESLPEFLIAENLQQLLIPPIIFSKEKLKIKVTSSTASIPVKLLKGYGPKAKIFISYGEKDSLTFGENMKATPEFQPALWTFEKDAGVINKNSKTVEIKNLKSSTKYYYRLRVESPEGKVWSTVTHSFVTGK